MVLTAGERTALLELLGHSAPKPDPQALTAVPILTELATTLEEVVAGRSALFEADRRALVADIDGALTVVGSRLSTCTSPTLRHLRIAEVSQLQATLADSQQSERLAAVLRDVLRQLREAHAVEAAWWDLVDAIHDDAQSSDICALRANQLRELVHVRGHGWWYVSMDIAQQVREGELQAACNAALTPPLDDATVAWVVFGNAHLERGYCRVGQAQFFTHKLTLSNIRDGCPALNTPEFEPALELTDDVIETFPDVKDEDHYVWVRVELSGPRAHEPPGGRRVPPVDWARDFAQSLVETAAFPEGGTEWQLLDGGYAFATEGAGGGSGWFRAPLREPERFFGSPLDEPTSARLQEFPNAVADALARDESAARFAAEEVRWHRTVQLGPDAAGRLALYVRGFERQWPTGPGAPFSTWEQPVRHYLREVWAHGQLQQDFCRVGQLIWRAAQDAGASARLQTAAGAVHAWGPRTSFTISYPAVIEHAPVVAGDFPGGSLQRRRTKQLVRHTRDGNALRDAWEHKKQTFDQLLNRAVRQRNRLIHGGAVVDSVAESVEPFLRQLSAWLVSESIEAARVGSTVGQVLDDLRDGYQRRYEHLRDAPADAFFGPLPDDPQ